MCVIFFAFNAHPDYPLILLANRDEYYDRPSATAAYWKDHPDIYGGRDLASGGTWLGVTKSGRFAAVTNYRDPSASTGTRSRGDLVAGFLKNDTPPQSYLEQIQSRGIEYSGFNLLVGTIGHTNELSYYSNRGGAPKQLAPGIYGLSNHLLDTPWPKVVNGKASFTDLLNKGEITDKNLLGILADETLAADEELPSTGIPYEAEKAISAIFIKTEGYGTRCSSLLKFSSDFEWSLEEKVFV
ncbi:MAG: NRDE family protein [Pyrinomonadaceae bacterium]